MGPQLLGHIKRGPDKAPSGSFVVVAAVGPDGTASRSWAVSPRYDPMAGEADPSVTEKDKSYLHKIFDQLDRSCFIPGRRNGVPALMPFTFVTR